MAAAPPREAGAGLSVGSGEEAFSDLEFPLALLWV